MTTPYTIYILTPDGQRHDLAHVDDLAFAHQVIQMINAVLLIVDGVAEVKVEKEGGLGSCEWCGEPYTEERDEFKYCPRCRRWIG